MFLEKALLITDILFGIFWSTMLALAITKGAVILSLVCGVFLVLDCVRAANRVRSIQDNNEQ